MQHKFKKPFLNFLDSIQSWAYLQARQIISILISPVTLALGKPNRLSKGFYL